MQERINVQYRLRISTHQIAFSRDIDLSASRCDVIRPRDRSREIAICGQRRVNKIYCMIVLWCECFTFITFVFSNVG